MGKQNRKQAPAKKPISSHPLFPAIVAMWFGALFGLGSLAVRASLLESIVIAGHIDTLVPSAAPPLGITARIMLALAMAMIGGTLGALIARRIARPKPVSHKRRRGAAPAAGSMEKRANFGLSAPVPAATYAQADEAERKTPAVTGRRRALTIEEEAFPAYILDAAPLPGGPPQILDVTEFDLADEEFEDTDIVQEAPAIAPYEVQPLDLSAFDSPGDSRFVQSQIPPDQVAQAPSTTGGQFSPPSSLALPDAAPAAFAAPAEAAIPIEAQPANEAEPVLEAQPAGTPWRTVAAPPQTLQRFAAPGALPGLFGAAPAETQAASEPETGASELHAPELKNSFAAPAAGGTHSGPPLGDTAPSGTQDIMGGADAAPAGEGPEAIVDMLADAGMTAPAEMALPDGRAAQRLVTAVLAELSPVELIERLALTLQNRKIVTTGPGQLAGTAPAAPAFASEPVSNFPATAFLAAVETAMPEPATDPAAASPVPAEGQATPPQFEPPAAPSQLRLTMPASLRPIDFEEYEDTDDSQTHDPLRSFSLPPAAASDASGLAAICSGHDSDAASCAEQIDAVSDAEVESSAAREDVVEDAYSSLLDLGRPVASRQQFIRIDEPEADSGEIEPVVIFPGHAGPTGGRFSAPVAMPVAAQPVAEVAVPAEIPAVRRFDVPGNAPIAGAAQPTAAAPSPDAAETEQALRSALASLQRMSGAA